MTWYVASIIMSVRTKNCSQKEIPVYENFVLVQGLTSEEALNKAKLIGENNEKCNDDLTLGDEPAVMKFEGIRKLINVSNPEPLDLDSDRPDNGTELSYSQYLVNGDHKLKALVEGKEVMLKYIE